MHDDRLAGAEAVLAVVVGDRDALAVLVGGHRLGGQMDAQAGRALAVLDGEVHVVRERHEARLRGERVAGGGGAALWRRRWGRARAAAEPAQRRGQSFAHARQAIRGGVRRARDRRHRARRARGARAPGPSPTRRPARASCWSTSRRSGSTTATSTSARAGHARRPRRRTGAGVEGAGTVARGGRGRRALRARRPRGVEQRARLLRGARARQRRRRGRAARRHLDRGRRRA